jgi:hypothetical protein
MIFEISVPFAASLISENNGLVSESYQPDHTCPSFELLAKRRAFCDKKEGLRYRAGLQASGV